jgi:hypothetical protein
VGVLSSRSQAGALPHSHSGRGGKENNCYLNLGQCQEIELWIFICCFALLVQFSLTLLAFLENEKSQKQLKF